MSSSPLTFRTRIVTMLAATTTAFACAFALAGCSQSTLPDSEEPALTTAAAPDAQDDGDAEGPATVIETVTEKPKDKQKDTEKCAQLPKDPREQYPSNSAPGRMPSTDGSDFNYWIEDIDNHYDPCAPVSWIIFHGGRGSVDGPAGTGAAVSDGIAFYIDGKPDGDMRTFRGITNVTLNDDTIDFSWSERQQDLTGSVKLQNHVTLGFDNGRIAPVSGDVEAFNLYWNGSQYMLGHYGE
ncbi:hypothetical protein KBX18_01350 [Corynebacterium sp. CCUG 69979]|uniref:hypothetical protein n=1 Tax=Corynebacterium sp. CCUG 69979 TaxID=2823890 RepID=UPI00210C8FC0|nr:hypothetical protein [Corynebacterium sp. CCUG 69979]MCQ4624215.1 hypothetical protein [Corynebacterium sp. CCUG 69979]